MRRQVPDGESSASSASLDEQGVAVWVGDGEGLTFFGGSDSFFMEMARGFAEAVGSKEEAGLGTEGCGDNLHLLAGFSGQMHEHLVAGDGFEVKLVDVEVLRGGWVFHGKRDP